MAKGWKLEPGRHALAAKGVKTGRQTRSIVVPVGLRNTEINVGNKYWLVNAQEMHQNHPETFEVPSQARIAKLKKGDEVKLCFNGKERMWVKIKKIDGDEFEGELDNKPFELRHLSLGDKVVFRRENIYQTVD